MRTLLLSLLAACADPITTQTLTDEGTACVDGDTITVTFPGCLSSSCDTLTSATCTATLEGTTLTVHAEATIESQGKECTADCGFITASCDAPATEGEVTLSYAGEDTPLAEATCEAF